MSSEHSPQQEPAVEAPTAASASAAAFAPSTTTSQAQILALQRSAGNAAVSRILGSRASAASLLGSAAAVVRLHRGPDADQRLAARPDALAVTEGTDIHLSAKAPPLESASGRLLLAHEAAHVVQQRTPGTTSTELAETEADEAAVAASLGRRAAGAPAGRSTSRRPSTPPR